MKLLTGVVEDLNDPLKIGRVRVRMHVIHPAEKNPNNQSGVGVATEHLAWAQPVQSIGSSAMNGVGTAPVGLEVGSWVVLSPLNLNEDIYLILGSLAGKADIHASVTGENTKILDNKNKIYKDEPKTPTNTEYPHNKSIHTKSGHLIEIDDTPGAERISVYHKSGTFLELHNDGVLVEKVIGKKYSISLVDNNLLAKGNINITAEQDVNLLSDNSNINITAAKNVNIISDTINATVSNATVNAKDKVKINGNNIAVVSEGYLRVAADSLELSGAGGVNIVSAGGINLLAGTKIRLSGKKVVNI